MKNQVLMVMVFSAVVLMIAVQSCKKENANQFTTVTQAELDAATTSVVQNLSGTTPYGNASISHNGTMLPPDSTLRDVYANFTGTTASPGNIMTKRVYMKNPDGSQGPLEVTFAMVKHEPGYWTAGGDWEYVEMPNMGSTNYTANPNGMLPATTDTMMRGKITMCQSCHANAPGNDFLFTK